jgi:hypothetical protein
MSANLINQRTIASRRGITRHIFWSNSSHMPMTARVLLGSDYKCALVSESLHVVAVDNLIIRRICKILRLLIC